MKTEHYDFESFDALTKMTRGFRKGELQVVCATSPAHGNTVFDAHQLCNGSFSTRSLKDICNTVVGIEKSKLTSSQMPIRVYKNGKLVQQTER